MHNRLYKILNDNNIIYPFQFGYQSKCSSSFAWIHLTETIKEAPDQEKYGCGILVDLQKVFDTVNHKILISKLKNYGIRGVAYSWFESCLKERKQYVSINGFNSENLQSSHGVSQGSVLGPFSSFSLHQ